MGMANMMYNKSELKEDVFRVRCAKKIAAKKMADDRLLGSQTGGRALA